MKILARSLFAILASALAGFAAESAAPSAPAATMPPPAAAAPGQRGGNRASTPPGADNYELGPDSLVHPGVPQGTWEKYLWDKSAIFPNTTREVWIYIPAQYDPKVAACLMVLQDGPRQYAVRERNDVDQKARRTQEYCTPTVLDNLINRKELPVIITVFINPGSTAIDANGKPDFNNRSPEYDTISDAYSQFLATEILPPIEKKYNIRKDPAGRAIGGISSGAICAFTVAFNHPDWFSKVISDVGSFTNIRGGHVYPQLVRNADHKPLRIHLQDGTNDQRRPETPERDWYLQNRLMLEALVDKGYDVQYVLGHGVHSSKHGASIFPDTLRWIWRDEVPGAVKTTAK
ncbi:MAG TPA: alpha/beta hydrolase-fold protein [Opitutaceae bacterium]|nr:alpha/beta hydrolase-fold protein [Opitutaceae bacterium]